MSNGNPKIVVLPSFYPMKFNYSGNFFEEQVSLIKKIGGDVSVIFNENRSIKSFSLKKFWSVHFQKQFRIEEGIPVLRRMNWNIIPTKFILGQKMWVKNSISLVELYIRKYGKPDLIHVHCALNAGIVAKYIKRKWNIPYVITEHLSLYTLPDISPLKIEESFSIYDSAERVIVVSSFLKNILSEKVGFDKKRMDIIPNFVDIQYFNPNVTTSIESVQGKIIFTVSRHAAIKRLDRLLDAFKIVSEEYPDWKLIIGGDGVETNNLKLKVNILNLQDKVIFTGFLTKQQVRSYMKQSDVFVLSSDAETFSVVLIEAMAMGLPVVATLAGGPEDIVTKSTGILVGKDVDNMAKGLKEMILNYHRYIKEDIRAHVINNFSGEAIAGKYINIYNRYSSHFS